MGAQLSNLQTIQDAAMALAAAHKGNVSFEKSKTLLNMVDAYTKASQASCAYAMVAELAGDSGYPHVAAAAQSAANTKMVHSKLWYKALKQVENVPSAISLIVQRELEAANVVYPRYIEEADVEGFNVVAEKFKRLIDVVHHQEKIWENILSQINLTTTLRNTAGMWQCKDCGYKMESDVKPDTCLMCDGKDSFVEYKRELLKYIAGGV